MKTPDVFGDLAAFYRELDSRLSKDSEKPTVSNPCGKCRFCCENFFYLSAYEFAYMQYFIKRDNLPARLKFQVSVTPENDFRLKGASFLCPLFDNEQSQCLVYEARPLPCRLFGRYVPAMSVKPEGCAFKETVFYSRVEEIPLWDAYVKVLRAHPSMPGFFYPV